MKKQSTTTNLLNKIKTSVLCTICVVIFFSCGENGGTEKDVLPDPVACFEYDPADELKAGDEISFTNCSENATSYVWDFGDGDVSSDESPTHTYSEPGTFTVLLIALNDGGADTLSADLTVVATSCKVLAFGSDYLFDYDNDGKLVAMREGSSEYRLGYKDGKVTTIDRYRDGSKEDGGVSITYIEGNVSRVTRSSIEDGQNYLHEFRFIYADDAITTYEWWDNSYYDEEGNQTLGDLHIVGSAQFKYTNGNLSKVELEGSEVHTYTYDDKVNPFYGNILWFLEGQNGQLYFSKNNVLTSTWREEYDDGEVETGSSTYSYEYNENDHPVKVTETYDDGDSWSSEWTYDCD